MKLKRVLASVCALAMMLTVMPSVFAANWPASIDFESGIGFAGIANKSAGDTNWAIEADPAGGTNKVLREGKKDGYMSDLRMYMTRSSSAVSIEFDTYRATASGVSYLRVYEGSTGGCSGDAMPFLVKLDTGTIRNNDNKILGKYEAKTWYTFKVELSADHTSERIYMKKRDSGSYCYIGSCVLPECDLTKTGDLFYYKYEYEAYAYVDNFKFNTLSDDVKVGFTLGQDGDNFDVYGDSSITDGNFFSGYTSVRASASTYAGTTTTGLFGKKEDDAALTASKTSTYIQNRNDYAGLKEGEKVHIGVSVAFDENATTANDYYDFQFLRTIRDTYAVAGTTDAKVRIAGADVLYLKANGDMLFTGGYATGLTNQKYTVIPNHWYRVDFVFTVGKAGTATTGVKNHVDIYLDGVKVNGYDFNGWDVNQSSMSGVKKTTDDIYALEGFAMGDLRFRTNANSIYMDDFIFDKTSYTGAGFSSSLNSIEFKPGFLNMYSKALSVDSLVNSISGADDVCVLASDFTQKASGNVVAGDILRVEADGTTYFYTAKAAETSILDVPMNALTNNTTLDGKLGFAKAGASYGPFDAIKATNYNDATTADTDTVVKNYMFNSAEILSNVGNRDDNVFAIRMKRPGAQYTYIKSGTKDTAGNYTSVTSVSSDPLYDPFTNIQTSGNIPYSTTIPVTFEGMFYQNSNLSSMYLSPNNAWTTFGIGTAQSARKIRVLGEDKLPYRANSWYKWVLTYSPKGNDVYEVKAYVNGDLISTKDFTIAGGLYRLKAGFSSPNASYNIIGAMDNERIYLGDYDPTDDIINVEPAYEYLTIDGTKLNSTEPITVADLIDSVETNAASIKIYTDATCQTEASATSNADTGNVLALVSSSGESYKYYDIVVPEPPVVNEYEYELTDNGEIRKNSARVGMYYQVKVNKVESELTLGVGEKTFTITDLGAFDVTTALTYAILGNGAATADISSDITVTSGINTYIKK